MFTVLQNVNRFIWGVPTLILILGIGVYISLRTRFVQIRYFPQALRMFVGMLCPKKGQAEGTSSFRALCTALAATVGTGNIVGVAGAVSLGGPGAIFWMWICAFFGMAIKFAEATLAVRYRQRSCNREWLGGPMYMVKNGLPGNRLWLGTVYCFFGLVAAFGVGNATQVNAVISGINSVLLDFSLQPSVSGNLIMGLLLALLIAGIFFGGAKRIGRAAEMLVPFASVLYILLCVGVVVIHYDRIPNAFSAIICGAFSPKAVTGGIIGSAFSALRVGASRGVFTNEAGMGTAGIAHSSAEVRHPAQQGLMGIIEVFLDTIVICTLTALVILVCDIWIPFGTDASGFLTMQAFSSVYGSWANILIAVCLCLFAVATIVGWGFYGLRCAQFLFGEGVWRRFALLQTAMVVLGAVLETGTVWLLSEIVNGLMAIPNLLALAWLTPELSRLTYTYEKDK